MISYKIVEDLGIDQRKREIEMNGDKIEKVKFKMDVLQHNSWDC